MHTKYIRPCETSYLVLRPNSTRRVNPVTELNRLVAEKEKIIRTALTMWKHRGCGCCVDLDKQDDADRAFGEAIGAKEFSDKSGINLWDAAEFWLGKD